MWFIIEILSFYGYILSAIYYIAESQIRSSLGWRDIHRFTDRFKYDFVTYHRKDLDWMAFVTILFNVNFALYLLDVYVISYMYD